MKGVRPRDRKDGADSQYAQETFPHCAPVMRFAVLEERLERIDEGLVVQQTCRVQQFDLQGDISEVNNRRGHSARGG